MNTSKYIDNKKKKGITASLLIILFLFYYALVPLSTHVHIVNGKVVVHMHFSYDTFRDIHHDKTPCHEHNVLDLIQLQYFTTAAILFFAALYILKTFHLIKHYIYYKVEFIKYKFLYLYCTHAVRAPSI